MTNFPVGGILPKDETGVAQLLAEKPYLDGRGQIVAVLDQGVDPGAAGLIVTSEGKPKVIDVIDTTGSGDVDTTSVAKVEIAEDGSKFLTGLTGRKLVLPAEWKNPSEKWNVGVIDLTKIFPSYLKNRMNKTCKDEEWSPAYNSALSNAQDNVNQTTSLDVTVLKNQMKKESAKETLEALKKLNSGWKNLSFIADVVVWNNGEELVAVLDSSFRGDLSSCKVMRDYATAQEWHKLSEETQLNYNFKIFDDKMVQVVCPSGSHGTHVAGIVAAYHPDEEDKNGIAPGAQIISVKIGDSRLNTLETQAGFIRGLRAAVRGGASIANFSYGEPAKYPMKGASAREITECYLKHKMLFITSAGNSGPALTTVGAPASISDHLLSVGAFAAPSSHLPCYSLKEQGHEINYTWSSRGPTQDGGVGVNVSAPGVAITAVPTATLMNNQLMNGTSMAAPSAAGAAACILSSLNGEEWTPAGLKRAMENGARTIPGAEKETQGRGLIQVPKSAEIIKNVDSAHYQLKVSGGKRGVYLREPWETEEIQTIAMSVKPSFVHQKPKSEIVAFEKHCLIKNPAKSWIRAPEFIHLNSGEKHFSIEVDPTRLPAGDYRSAHLTVVESGNEQEVLFVIPVTVVKPLELDPGATKQKELNFSPGQIERQFFKVPVGASYAKVTVAATGSETGRFMVHVAQLENEKHFDVKTEEKFYSLNSTEAPKVFAVPVSECGTVELTLAKFWSSQGQCTARWSIEFGGLSVTSPTDLAQCANEFIIKSPLPEKILPKATFDQLVIPMAPQNVSICPIESLPYDKPLNEAERTFLAKIDYSFSLGSKSDITMNCPTLEGLLYESEFSETLIHVFDSHNKHVFTTEVLKPSSWKVNLPKADYKVQMHIAGTNYTLLESLSKNLQLDVLQKLSKPVAVDAFWKHMDALAGAPKAKDKTLKPNTPVSLYLGPGMTELDQSDLAKAEGGRYLKGSLTILKDDVTKKVEKHSIRMSLRPRAKSKTDAPPKSEKDNSIETIERNANVSWVKAGHGGSDYFKVAVEKYPDHVPLHHARLQFLTKESKVGAPVTTDEVAKLCEVIEQLVDLKTAIYNSSMKGKLTADEQKLVDAAKEEKAALQLATVTKIRAKLSQHEKGGDDSAVLELLKNLLRMNDFIAEGKDKEVLKMNVEVGMRLGFPGLSLKAVSKLTADSDSKDLAKTLASLYSDLGWDFAATNQEQKIVADFPHAQLFL
ncbi:Oidioi.mRNA.OKI2018_I69.XSR.g13790.t2.cds [Oikopleura dioica]|uniref:tripeptidyl-peptidase II n=1 Tax=Oikopleura dioica TaxID=34765 RepID=A0ABN7SBP4_OIKDI|nr:Oidioi.mRNA.OKI2018_I69.XSR.g13790.t2.cds [Oikopleura dioica]